MEEAILSDGTRWLLLAQWRTSSQQRKSKVSRESEGMHGIHYSKYMARIGAPTEKHNAASFFLSRPPRTSDAMPCHAMPTSGMLDRLRGRVCSPIKFESLRCLNGQSTQVDFWQHTFPACKADPGPVFHSPPRPASRGLRLPLPCFPCHLLPP